MATWGVHLYRGGFAGHVFAVAAEKARVEKENAQKPAPERTQLKREWHAQQTRHALAEALSEVLRDLRTGTGDAAAAPAEAADAAASAGGAPNGGAATASPGGTAVTSTATGTAATAGTSSPTGTSSTTGTSAANGSSTTGTEAATGAKANDDADAVGAVNPSARRDGEHPVREAVHDFMHALFEALRPSRGEGGGNGRGFGWGRTSVADVAQRIERLAQSFATPTAPPPAAGDATASGSAAGGASGEVSTTTPAPAPSTPAAETTPTSTPTVPPTPTTDSSLLEAFSALVAVLPGDRASTAAANPADALSSLLHRLAQALQGEDGGDARPAAGCLIDVTA